MSTIATSLVTDHEVARHRLTLASVGDDGGEDAPGRGVSPVGGRPPGVGSACVGAGGGVRSDWGRSVVGEVPSGADGLGQHDVRPALRRSWASVRQGLRLVWGGWSWRHDLLFDTLAESPNADAALAAAPAGHRATWQSLLWTGVGLGLLQPASALFRVAPERRPTVVFASLPPAALPLVFAVAQVADVNVQLMDSSPVTHRHISADREHSLCLSTLGCRIDETIQHYISTQLPQSANVEVVCPASVCQRESTIWLLTGQPAVDPQVYDEVLKVAYLASSDVVQPIGHTAGHGGGPQIWPICIENGIGWVGPAEAKQRDGCHYCHWLRRATQNPRWAAHLIQAINGNPPSVGNVLPMMTSVVAYAVVSHTMLVDGRQPPVWAAMPGPHQAVRVCAAPSAYVDIVDSAPHPQCQCSSRNVGHTWAAHMAEVG